MVQFVVGQCTVTAYANVSSGQTPEQICNALKINIGTSCNCTFTCAESTISSGCWVLGDSPACNLCDTGQSSGCCGVSLRGGQPEWG